MARIPGTTARTAASSFARRNSEWAGPPGSCSITSGFAAGVARRRRVQRCGKLCHIAFQLGDLAGAALGDLVDPEHGMHGQETALDAVELRLDPLLRRIEQHAGALAEGQLLHLDETQHRAMTDLAGVDLVNLALVHEQDAEYVM